MLSFVHQFVTHNIYWLAKFRKLKQRKLWKSHTQKRSRKVTIDKLDERARLNVCKQIARQGLISLEVCKFAFLFIFTFSPCSSLPHGGRSLSTVVWTRCLPSFGLLQTTGWCPFFNLFFLWKFASRCARKVGNVVNIPRENLLEREWEEKGHATCFGGFWYAWQSGRWCPELWMASDGR